MKRTITRAITLLSLIALPAALTAAPSDSDQVELEAVMLQALDAAFEVMFKPGDPDPNWSKGGIDVEAAVEAKPNQALLEIDKDGERSITLYSDRPLAQFIPAEWELVAEIGSENQQSSAGEPIEISQLEDGYYIASRGPYERVGSATCSKVPEAARLYKVKGSSNEMSPEIAELLFREMLERAKGYTVCVRTDVDGEGYRNKFFLKDGRPLPFFNERSGKATIVPLRPTAELLRGE